MKDKAEGQWVGRVEKLFKQFMFGAASLKEGDREKNTFFRTLS